MHSKMSLFLALFIYPIFCSNLLEKTTDAVIKAAKSGDMVMVIIDRIFLFHMIVHIIDGANVYDHIVCIAT